MHSPFPGMDPYIETTHLFEDFHHHLIDEIHRAIAAVLPERYVVRAAERSYIGLAYADDLPDERLFIPDVTAMSRRGSLRKKKPASVGVTEATAPGAVMMRALVKAEYREPYLEIRQVAPEHKLITGIEVLSPSNKRPNTKGWRLYNRKRLAYLSGHANLVEIDLLRRGQRMPMTSAWPASPYYLLVCRKQQAPRCWVCPAFFDQPAPAIPIPLAPPDPDLIVQLQPFIDTIYARSRYHGDIDYQKPLDPPLSPAEAKWLQARLRQQRSAK